MTHIPDRQARRETRGYLGELKAVTEAKGSKCTLPTSAVLDLIEVAVRLVDALDESEALRAQGKS